MLELVEIFWSFQIAALVYVLTIVLFEEGYLLEWYYDLLIDLKNGGKLGKWLSKPLGLCERCTAGQFGLWVWFYLNGGEYLQSPILAALKHGIFISFSIIFISVIKYILSKWKK